MANSAITAARKAYNAFVKKVQRAITIHGVLGTTKLCIAAAARYFLWFTPSQRRYRAVAQERDSQFDREWGVETSGTLVPSESEVVGANWAHGIKYHGCNSTLLAEILRDLTLHYEHFAFVDLGSGKGRAILVASRFPFRKIVGVEYSEQLCDIARHNVSSFPKAEKKCNTIDVLCGDAAAFPIPEGPLLLFLFNPFGRQVMQQVVTNVRTSYQQNPRRIIVVYFTAQFADLWRDAGFMEEIRSAKWIAIYDTQARAGIEGSVA